MALKGKIQAGEIPNNAFEFLPVGLPGLTVTKATFPEETLEVMELPDRTKATAGAAKVGTFTLTIPEHHKAEQAALEAWLVLAKKGAKGYKLPASFVAYDNAGNVARTYSFVGVFPIKRKAADRDMTGDTLSETEWEFSVDEILPA